MFGIRQEKPQPIHPFMEPGGSKRICFNKSQYIISEEDALTLSLYGIVVS
jgi:hypothetical protein